MMRTQDLILIIFSNRGHQSGKVDVWQVNKKPLIEEKGEKQKSPNNNHRASPPATSIYVNSSEDDEVDGKTIIEYRPQDYREE
jgi:hypothetical protein